jgi:hypothetical protein
MTNEKLEKLTIQDFPAPSTVQAAWKSYQKQAYGRFLLESEKKEIHQAFYAGTLVALSLIQASLPLSSFKAVVYLNQHFKAINRELTKNFRERN